MSRNDRADDMLKLLQKRTIKLADASETSMLPAFASQCSVIGVAQMRFYQHGSGIVSNAGSKDSFRSSRQQGPQGPEGLESHRLGCAQYLSTCHSDDRIPHTPKEVMLLLATLQYTNIDKKKR